MTRFVVFLLTVLTVCYIRSSTCQTDVPVIEHRLDIQAKPSKGLLLVRRAGRSEAWGTVCDDGWTNPNNALVACRALGYDSGTVWSTFDVGNRSTPIYLDSIDCRGNETSLAQCMTTSWGENDCLHTEDVALRCFEREKFLIEARLRGGSRPNSGLLEVRKAGDANSTWGSVCDDRWNLGNESNVQVACRSMGHKWGMILESGTYPLGSGEIHLDDVQCEGNELNLANCSRANWQEHNCIHGEDIGLACYDSTVVLPMIGDDLAYGTVSLAVDGVIHSVCDGTWTDNDAKVACRELGYQYYKPLCCSQYPGLSKLSTSRDSVLAINCNGNEANLAACPRTMQYGSCSYNSQASVVCSKNPIPSDSDVPVRLIINDKEIGTSYGHVQVSRYGIWSDVCSQIGDEEAQVICKQKNYPSGWVMGSWYSYPSQDPAPFKNLSCSGEETSLKDCSYNWSNQSYCPIGWRASVICSSVANEAAECRRTRLGTEYMGLLNTSSNGRTCQRWDAQFPHSHVYNDSDTFPDGDVHDAQNYCRNPDGWEYGVWCYTTDPDKRWDTCQVPMCNSTDCRYDVLGLHYHGTLGTTEHGLTCQRWDGQTPHAHKMTSLFADVGSAANYCRNPDGHHEGPWCYTTDPDVRWQLCDIPYCSFGCKQTDVGTEYSGHLHVTASGRRCQRWDSGTPHANIYQYDYGSFPADGSPAKAENFCRNPDKDNRGPWCFTMDANVEKEGCNIQRCSSIQVRLADGGPNYGRVEVRYDGVWGTVCQQGFRTPEALVVCKQLGFWGGEVKSDSAFGTGTGPVYLNWLNCGGHEDNIIKCKTDHGFKNVTDSCRSHNFDVGVICHGKIRLMQGGNEYAPRSVISGAVEVAVGSDWKLVCGTGWGDTEARVACKELGYDYGKSLCCASFGDIWKYGNSLGSVSCIGNETSLSDCPSSGRTCVSRWENYGSVHCSKSPINTASEFTVSLDKTSTGYEHMYGEVIIHKNGTAGVACASDWTDTEAAVVCRELGSDGGVAMSPMSRVYTDHFYPVVVSGVNCTGRETALSECQYQDTLNCWTPKRAGVLCYNGTRGVRYRLQGGNHPSLGRVEISYNGIWGTVCSNQWSRYDTMVFCKQLNYTGGEPMWDTYSSIDAPRYVGGFRCDMTESTLLMCENDGWRKVLANNCTQAAASCYNTTRLAFKIHSYENVLAGQVRAFTRSNWFTVCGTGFGQAEATVTCRAVGFPYGISEPGLMPVVSATPNVLSRVQCTGTEASIIDCRFTFGSQSTQCPNVLNDQAVAICGGTPFGDAVRSELIPDSSPSSNHTNFVVITMHGITAPLCWSQFDHNAATVTCKAAGYRFGAAQKTWRINPAQHTWMVQFKCNGRESNLTDCQQVRSVANREICNRDKSYATVVCYNEALKFRLSGGTNIRGRVEVYRDGQWGSVCCNNCRDDMANVACRQFGYLNGSLTDASRFPGTTTHTSMTVYRCDDDDDGLLSCYSRWVETSSYTCLGQDLAIQCFAESTIGDGTHSGVLQFAYQKQLLEVCRDSFTDNDAAVACRTNQFSFKGRSVQCGNYPLRGSEVIRNFACTGTESRLSDCRPQAMSRVECASGQAAVVSCMYGIAGRGGLQGEARLTINGTVIDERGVRGAVGTLNVNISGVNARIGVNGWNDDAATLACTSMGYAWGVAYKHGPVASRVPFLVDGVSCSPGQTDFMECLDKHHMWRDTGSCNTTVAAGVICLSSAYLVPSFRIATSGVGHYGRLLVHVLGLEGAVCADGFTQREATVACRQFGKRSGRLSNHRYPMQDRIIIEGLRCNGDEARLMDCIYGGIDDYVCPSGRQVALECFDEVFITGGPASTFGRVQVTMDDQRVYTVCDDGFDDTAAEVVCRGLGYSDGKKICCEPFGRNLNWVQPFINNIRCQGNEKSLLNCTYDKSTCTSAKYGSVYCTTTRIDPTQNWNARIMGNEEVAYSGEVALYNKGIWGRVCSDLWDDKDATVFCKKFGYAGGVAYKNPPVLNNPIMWGSFNCTGSEASIITCPHSGVYSAGGCSDYLHSAGVLCYRRSAPTMRLADGHDHVGRVEIGYDGVYGTVCNELWSSHDARVACRQISSDYVDGIWEYVSYGSGSGPVYMARVNCTGDESSLFQCANPGWKVLESTGCTSRRMDTAAKCFKNVRLSGDSHGQVLVYLDGKWGTVCDSGWDRNDANVVCKSLGYTGGFAICCSAFGRNFGPISVTESMCTGQERNYLDCPMTKESSCKDDRYASAVCYTGTIPSAYTALRLVNGNENSGAVEINYNGVWGRICTDGWDDRDAKVVCGELGYENGMAYTHYKDYFVGGSQGLYWTSNVDCKGGERTLQSCQRERYGFVQKCDSRHPAGVMCYRTRGIYFRLSGATCPSGACPNEGILQVEVDGTWGNVCEPSWSDRDAHVFCRSVQYATGVALDNTRSQRNRGDLIWHNDIYCQGDENALEECPHTAWKKQYDGEGGSCRSNNDAGVYCYKELRIHNSTSSIRTKSGSLEMYRNDTYWSPVCAENFTDYHARRACTEMGYADGTALCCSPLGPIYSEGMPFTDLSDCDNTHSTLSVCGKNTTTCRTYAGIVCANAQQASQKNVYKFDLEPGSSNSHGRLIVSYLGESGRVCSNGWDDTDAAVFCRSKGFAFGMAQRLTDAPFSTKYGRLPYFVSNFRCSSQTRLEACPFDTGLELGNCSRLMDAGVFCYNGGEISYRLGAAAIANVDVANSGRVEIGFDGAWGTVCDWSWNDKAASVFCKSLGDNFNGGDPLIRVGGGQGSIWLTHLVCDGTEANLHSCGHPGFAVAGAYCSHRNDAGAVCYKSVRLNQRVNPFFNLHVNYGTVSAYTSTGWGGICDDQWSDTEAVVVCKELGYSYGKAVPRSSFGLPFSETSRTYSGVQCRGTETSINDCTKRDTDKCDYYAGVYCSKDALPDIDFQVNTSRAGGLGIVSLIKNGISGRICKNGWGFNQASVACRQMGYKGGVPYVDPAPDSRPIILSNVSCTGLEEGLQQCQSTDWGDAYTCVSHRYEAGVICYNQSFTLRLSGSDGTHGRIDIEYDGRFGTVCDMGFGHAEAKVVCGQLGFVDGIIPTEVYPPGQGQEWLSKVKCRGDEEHLLTCRNTGWGLLKNEYCGSHKRDAKVKCFREKIAITKVRLVNGGLNYGRVEVYASGVETWGTVCDDSWDDDDATIVCRMLGFEEGEAQSKAKYGPGIGRILLDNVNCTGTERSLNDCPSSGIGDHNCQHREDASVICSNTATTTVSPATTVVVPKSTSSNTPTNPPITEPVTNPTASPPTRRPTEEPGAATTPPPIRPRAGESSQQTGSPGGAIAAGIIIPILLICAAVAVAVFLYRRYRSGAIPRQHLGGSGNGAPVAVDNVLYGMNMDDDVIAGLSEQSTVAGETPGVTIDNANLVTYAAPVHQTPKDDPTAFGNETYA